MTTRYAKSFHKKVRPPAGERCSLKWHYTGVMRELIGFFDEMATLDETGERFVFTSIAYIIETAEKNCKRFNGKPYSESSIRHGLAEARARRVISKLLERERWLPSGEKGHQMLRALGGSIVANHDCVTHFENGECTWVGPMHGCGRWQRTGNGGPGSVLYWNGCGLHAPATSGLPNGKQSLSASNAGHCADGVQGTVHTTVQSTVQTVCRAVAEPVALADSGQPSELPEVKPKNGGQAVVTVMPVQTALPAQPEQPTNPVEPAPLVQAAAQESKPGRLTTSQGGGACAPTTGHNDDKSTGRAITIGAQFLPIKNDMDLLIQITDGIFNPHPYKQTNEIDVLAKYLRATLEEEAAKPWDKQRQTLALIVDQVIKCAAASGLKQKGFFKALKELQQGGPCKMTYTPPPLTDAQQFAALRARGIVASPLTKHSSYNGEVMHLCCDFIYRQQEDLTGFVKSADGVWDKP